MTDRKNETIGEVVHPPELDLYGDPGISSYDAKVPNFLKYTYAILPVWGIITWLIFWNGSVGFFDRGYWKDLQIAANTTFPIENQNMTSLEKGHRESREERGFPRKKPAS